MESFENATQKLQIAEKSLNNIKNNYPSKLAAFDGAYKANFIAEKIGKAPVKPHGAIKLAVPVYLVKKAKYEKEYEEYQRLLPLAEAAYREAYALKRDDLQKKILLSSKKQ